MFCMMQLDVIWATKELGFKRLSVYFYLIVHSVDVY